MKHLFIGAALVALAAGPLAAQGNDHGKGQAGGHGNSAHGGAMQGPAKNGPSMQGAGPGNAKHGGGSMASAMEASAPAHGNGNGKDHGNGKTAHDTPAMKHGGGAERPVMAHAANPTKHDDVRGPGNPIRVEKAKDVPAAGLKVLPDGRRYYTARNSRDSLDFVAARRGLVNGCPPGLAKKNNGCMPPGLAKQRTYQPNWWGLRGVNAGPYLYDNGYLLRMNGDAVAGYVPLLGGALSPGNIWPSNYAPVAVPPYYVDYYDLGAPNAYRYADNVLYRVDPSTSAINSIAALLTGDTFQIGSPMPLGYDVYNVPYPYRSQYVDGPNSLYRYSDGYIYQVDPTTQLVTAAIDLLAGRGV